MNHAVGVYIINSVGIAYHQCRALYIIKPQIKCTLARDEIQGRNAPLMIYATLRASMIYQACGLDKKTRQVETCRIFWLG